MPAIPQLSAAQWRAIEPKLPANRRDPVLISAVLYRTTQGAGIRDVCELFGVTRTRLSETTQQLEADGSLSRVMKALRLKPANPLVWRGASYGYWRRRGIAANVTKLKLNDFSDALRHGRRGRASIA